MNIAIVTARGGSQRLPGKHLEQIGPYRLLEYPLRAAKGAIYVGRTYLVTDSDDLAGVAKDLGLEILMQPPGLGGPLGNQAEAVRWAVGELSGRVAMEMVVALLGNTVMIRSEDIDTALMMLERHPQADGVMTVWEAEDDHPLRALRLREGFLAPYEDRPDPGAESQRYPTAYYQDQGLWVFRPECVAANDGPAPWTWAGRRCIPLVRKWWAGRDVDVEHDLILARWYARREMEQDWRKGT